MNKLAVALEVREPFRVSELCCLFIIFIFNLDTVVCRLMLAVLSGNKITANTPKTAAYKPPV